MSLHCANRFYESLLFKREKNQCSLKKDVRVLSKMGNQQSNCCQRSSNRKTYRHSSDDENEYDEPYNPYDGYDGDSTYSIYEKTQINEEQSPDSGIKNEGFEEGSLYETYGEEIGIPSSDAARSILNLIFIVQKDENDSRSCTLQNKKIFRNYLNRFSIESKKQDIQFEKPLYVDRKLPFLDTKEAIFDELENFSKKFINKVQDSFHNTSFVLTQSKSPFKFGFLNVLQGFTYILFWKILE